MAELSHHDIERLEHVEHGLQASEHERQKLKREADQAYQAKFRHAIKEWSGLETYFDNLVKAFEHADHKTHIKCEARPKTSWPNGSEAYNAIMRHTLKGRFIEISLSCSPSPVGYPDNLTCQMKYEGKGDGGNYFSNVNPMTKEGVHEAMMIAAEKLYEKCYEA